tara:strand:- start:13441 stop:13851 length:411 start_codon:yes stop_codon:yes gene_type:complete
MPNQMMIVQYKSGDIHAYNPEDPSLSTLWRQLEQIQSVVYAEMKSQAPQIAQEDDFFFCIDEDIPLPLLMKGLRIMHGRSQQYIADQMGIPQTTISKWERTSTAIILMPTKEQVYTYLSCLGLSDRLKTRIVQTYF